MCKILHRMLLPSSGRKQNVQDSTEPDAQSDGNILWSDVILWAIQATKVIKIQTVLSKTKYLVLKYTFLCLWMEQFIVIRKK